MYILLVYISNVYIGNISNGNAHRKLNWPQSANTWSIPWTGTVDFRRVNYCLFLVFNIWPTFQIKVVTLIPGLVLSLLKKSNNLQSQTAMATTKQLRLARPSAVISSFSPVCIGIVISLDEQWQCICGNICILINVCGLYCWFVQYDFKKTIWVNWSFKQQNCIWKCKSRQTKLELSQLRILYFLIEWFRRSVTELQLNHVWSW